LLLAAMNGHPQAVSILLEHGAEVDFKDPNGRTALTWASIYGHSVTAKLLIDKGADLSLKDQFGRTALDYALVNHRRRLVDGVSYNPIPNVNENAKHLCPHIVIKSGNITKNSQFSQLDVAQDDSDSAALSTSTDKLYPKHPKDIPVQISSANIRNGKLIPLSTESSLFLEDKMNEFFLQCNQNENQLRIVFLPLLMEGKICFEEDDRLETFEILSGDILDRRQAEQLTQDYLRSQTVQIRSADKELEEKKEIANTALLRAAMEGRSMSAMALLDKGAEVNTSLSDGWTPLMVAAWNGHLSIVNLFLDRGANLESQTLLLWTPLMIAAWSGHLDVVRCLIKRGANVESRDKNGKTILMWACQKGNVEIVKLILRRGVNVNAQNPDGWTAVAYASREGHAEIVAVLKEVGSPNWVPPKDDYNWKESLE
jgi:ankyrin repeat protein